MKTNLTFFVNFGSNTKNQCYYWAEPSKFVLPYAEGQQAGATIP